MDPKTIPLGRFLCTAILTALAACSASAVDTAGDGGSGPAFTISPEITTTAPSPAMDAGTPAPSFVPSADGAPGWSSCLPHGVASTCAAFCAGVGAACSGACVNPYTGTPAAVLTFTNATCTAYALPFTWSCDGDAYGYKSTRCCCEP